MTSEQEIKQVILDRNGKAPFTVWSAGFLDIRNGQVLSNSGMLPHKGVYKTIDQAIAQYVGFAYPGNDVRVTQEPRIVDANNDQVYP